MARSIPIELWVAFAVLAPAADALADMPHLPAMARRYELEDRERELREECRVEDVRAPDEQCVVCDVDAISAGRCERLYGSEGYRMRCSSNIELDDRPDQGPFVWGEPWTHLPPWIEVWCRPRGGPPPAPEPPPRPRAQRPATCACRAAGAADPSPLWLALLAALAIRSRRAGGAPSGRSRAGSPPR